MNSQELSPQELVTLLHEGQIIPGHSPTRFLVERAVATGDYDTLIDYFARYPMILCQAQRNIEITHYQQLENPFGLVSREDANQNLSGPLKLGYVNKNNDLFGINPDELSIPMFILGPVGGGKSNFLKYLLRQLLTCSGQFNLIIPDLKREYRNLLHVKRNIKIFNNATLRINPLQKPDWISADDFIVFWAKIFIKANFLAGTSNNTLIRTLNEMYQKRGVHNGTGNWPTLQDLYKDISDQLGEHKSFHYRDIFLWLLNRLYPYMKHQIFNCRTGIPDRFWREENVVLELGKGVTDNMYAFLVSYLAGLRFLYNQTHDLTGQHLSSLILVDEGRILLDVNRNVENFGESYITEIITKTREYGLGFIFATHESASVNRTLRAIAGIKVAMPLTDRDDVEFIEKSFGLTEAQRDHIYKIDRKGIAIASYRGFRQPFLLGIPYVDLGPQVSDEQVNRHMAHTLASLGREIQVDTVTSLSPDAEVVPSTEQTILKFLSQRPFTKISDLHKSTEMFSQAEIAKALVWLETNGYIRREPHRVSRRGRKSHFAVLTDQAHKHFGYKPVPGHGSFEHKLYQHLIWKRLRNKGLKAHIEGRLSGSSKSMDILSWDEAGRIVGYEVTLQHHNIVSNINQDLNAGASKVVVVCRNQVGLDKARRVVGAHSGGAEYQEKVHFAFVADFFN